MIFAFDPMNYRAVSIKCACSAFKTSSLIETLSFIFSQWRHFHTQRIIQIFLMDWVQIHHKMKEELGDWKFPRI